MSAISRSRARPQLERAAAGGPVGAQNGVAFSALRAEFTRQSGQLTIRDGVVKGPTIGATIEGSIDYIGNQRAHERHLRSDVRVEQHVRPDCRLLGLFLGGGSNEGLIGVTYEVVGTPGQPVLRVNPISAMVPGVMRKIFEFNTGKQNNPIELPPNN